MTPAFVVTTQTYGQREDAKAGFWADWEIAFSGGFAWTFNNPLWQASRGTEEARRRCVCHLPPGRTPQIHGQTMADVNAT
jgi:hypothetical protein